MRPEDDQSLSIHAMPLVDPVVVMDGQDSLDRIAAGKYIDPVADDISHGLAIYIPAGIAYLAPRRQ